MIVSANELLTLFFQPCFMAFVFTSILRPSFLPLWARVLSLAEDTCPLSALAVGFGHALGGLSATMASFLCLCI